MSGKNTEIYIDIDQYREGGDPIPLPEQFNDRSLLEAFVRNTADFDLMDGFDVSKSVSEMSEEALKMRAINVLQAAQTNSDYRALLMNGARLNDIASDWAQRAAANASESGNTTAKFYADAANEELTSGRAMMQNALTKEEFLLGTAKFARAAGKIFGFLGLVMSVGKGLYTGVADDTFKGIFSTLTGALVGGAIASMVGLAFLTGWEFIAVGAAIATVAFAAGKFSDAIWDYGLGEWVWDILDEQGIGDSIRQGFATARQYLFGSDEVSPESFSVKFTSGGVYQVSGDEIHAYGTDGDDTFKTNWGRSVFLGGAGMDTYEFTTGNLKGVQSVVDSDGSGKLVIDEVEVGQIQVRRLSEATWVSLDGLLHFTLVDVNGV